MLLHKLRFISASLLVLFCIMLIWVRIKQCPPQKQLFSYEIVDNIHVPIINALFEDADRFKYDLVYPKADSCFRKIWQSKPSHLTTARDSFYCANQLAFINLSMNRNDEAEKWIAIIERMGGESRMATDALGDYWYNKGVWAYRMDKPKYADIILQKSLKLLKETYTKPHLKVAYCNNMIGLHHIEYDMSATHSFIKDANDFFESDSHLKKYAKENMLAMAQLCRNDDEYFLGEDYCNKGEEIANNLPYFDTILVSRLLSLRGYMMRKQNQQENKGNDSSINAVHLKSIEYASKANSVFLQEAYNFYAYYWINKNPYCQSSINAAFRECINNIKAITQSPNRERYAYVDLLEGYCLTQHVDKEKYFAISHYENFMRKYAKDPVCPKWFQEHALYTLSDLYKETKEFDLALNCVKRDLVFGTDFEDKQSLTWNDLMQPEIQKLKHYQFIDYGLAAGIFFEKGKLDKLPISDRNKNDLDMAFHLYCLADSLLYNSLLSRDEDAILKKIKREGDRIYSGAIELTYLLYRNAPKNNQKYLEKAYLFMERRKAQLLLQHQKWTSKSQYSMQTRKLLEDLKDCEYRIHQLKGKDSINSQNANMSITTLQNKKEAILDSLTAQNPSYSILEDTYLPEISTIKEKLKPSQVIVNYHVGQFKTHLLIFKQNTEQAAFEEIDIKEETLNKHIDSFMNSITFSGMNDKSKKIRYINASKILYKDLIFQLSKHLVGVNEIIVIPDKSIHRVPFDAILDANISNLEDSSYKKLPYLLRKYKFSYSTSIKSYWKNKDIPMLKNLKAVAFVDPQFHEHLSIFKGYYPCHKYYTNVKCSKDNFIQNAGSYNLIQISLHGASSSEKKDKCRILFSDAEKDILYGYELNKTHFDASLIVIASCQAAEGNVDNTEGPFSMYRYFLQAGAGVVIAPLTKIDAPKTADILGLFYSALKTPKMPEDALWESKKNYLDSTSNLESQYQPYFWSGLSCFR